MVETPRGERTTDPLEPVPDTPVGEPARVVVLHVLVAFEGSGVSGVTRTRAEAEALARDLLARVRRGDDPSELVREFSDDYDPDADGPPGVFRLANTGVFRREGELERAHLVRGMGDLAFRLDVGETGLVAWSTELSPLGFHVVKRLE